MTDKPETAILPCRKCGAMPVLETPHYHGLYGDLPMMLRPIGPDPDSRGRKDFYERNPPYLRCDNCARMAAMLAHPEAIKKWNEEQQN